MAAADLTSADTARTEDEQERLNRQMAELLQELRVAVAGVQVLFGFLLAVPFQQRFESASSFQRTVYGITLLGGLAALAVAMSGAVLLVTDSLFGSSTATVVVVLVASLYVALRFVLGLVQRIRS